MKKGKPKKRFKLPKFSKGAGCAVALAVILTVSAMGYVITSIVGEDTVVQDDQLQARVIIDFGNFSRVSDIVNLTQGATAQDAFNQLVTVQMDYADTGFIITSIESDGMLASFNGTHMWVFYVNGRLNFDPFDSYKVRHADVIELRFEEEPY